MSDSDTTPRPADATILELRDFSRKLVRELGFMRSTLAGSELAPSAVHAVLEIGMAPGISAKELGEVLRLDKSNTSRQLARLEGAGFVERRAAAGDARTTALYLTTDGRSLRKRIDRFATDQVSNALRRMLPADQQALLRSLALYAGALAQDGASDSGPADASGNATDRVATAPQSASIVEGYRPGCIGDIASLHGRFYAGHWGFGSFFEKRVATELAAFADALPGDGKALWLCTDHGRCLASVAIDGDRDTRLAHLRWFIVDDSLRGTGIGRQLLDRAMRFVDEQGFRETYLWTFKGLDAARHLYESFGFGLAEEFEGTQWGTTVTEQRFVRRRGGK